MTIYINEKQEPFYAKISDINSDNLMENDKAICCSCDSISSYSENHIDLLFSNKLMFENKKAYTCSECGSPVGYKQSVIDEINKEYKEFLDNRPHIDELLIRGREDSYRWCDNTMCGCVGAANCSGQLSSYFYTKKEWILWKEKNKQAAHNLYEITFHKIGHRMTVINILKSLFNIGVKDAANILNKPYSFYLEYNIGEDEFITSDLNLIKDTLTSHDCEISVYDVLTQDKKILGFIRERD